MKPTNSCIARLILGSSIEPLTGSRAIMPFTPRDIDEVGLDQLTLTHDSTYKKYLTHKLNNRGDLNMC